MTGPSLRWYVALGALALLAACSGRSGCATESSTGTSGEAVARATFAGASDDATSARPEDASGGPALPGVEDVDPALVARLASALADRGADYEPRTHHLEPNGAPTYTNRLILETSPYLVQHAHNPVSWFPWGGEAFERARRENKPVLLSVGYSTCHWCHVMERESFEDIEIAQLLNESFVAIKVDREERPDVDSLYMSAVHQLVGRGGWPMTVVLTPEREPFFAGTYFPARDGDRGARKGFLTILRELRDQYRDAPDEVVAQARQVTERLQAASQPARPGDLAGPEAIQKAVVALARRFDAGHGGFGGAPKFPTPSNLDLLARYHRRTKDPQALHILERTLEAMAAGGIYDHVGGGFHRYTVDAAWLVPHFEKMLYDNAQLVTAYLEGYQITGREDFAGVARHMLDYVRREMTNPSGAFYSATDADSPVPGEDHEEEGWFFTWTPAELRAVLDAAASRAVTAYYGVTPRGNFEGRNILHVAAPLKQVATSLGVAPAVLAATLEGARRKLYEARLGRPAPLRDDKIIAAWNGLMISAFARGALVLGEPAYAQQAVAAAETLLKHMKEGDALRRTWMDGQARHEGVLDDYAFLAQGLLDLHEATQNPRWLREAIALHDALAARFWDEANGGFFLTPSGHEGLLTREKPSYDGAEPSGNSVAILNLLRLEELTSDDRYRRAAERSLRAFSGPLRRGGGSPRMLSALDYYLDQPLEVVIVTSVPDAAKELEAVMHRSFVPNRIYVKAVEGAELARQRELIPMLSEKRVLAGDVTAFVCRGRVCEQPTGDPTIFARQLARVQPLTPNALPPLPVAGAAELPKPWEYDARANRHWHPGHRHWHDGPPPPQGAR